VALKVHTNTNTKTSDRREHHILPKFMLQQYTQLGYMLTLVGSSWSLKDGVVDRCRIQLLDTLQNAHEDYDVLTNAET
jgi:hypothetical protein